MKNPDKITIPLTRPDLSQEDKSHFLQQISHKNFSDPKLVYRWEIAWEEIWQRGCVAFADPYELIYTLQNTINFLPGQDIQTSPLLHPIWREALLKSWLNPVSKNVLQETGQEIWTKKDLNKQIHIKVKKVKSLIQHNFGLPAEMDPERKNTLEDISAILKPLNPDSKSNSKAQLLLLDGNRMLQGGVTCLVLSKDENLIRILKKKRKKIPAAVICLLGLSQLNRLDDLLERREELATNYLNLYNKESFTLPPSPLEGRRWESFVIQLPSPEKQQELQLYLNKAGIGAAPPIWYHITDDDDDQALSKIKNQSLALPLYASLSDKDQKKIINRIHRWVDRDTAAQ
jgi:hypothetical protein